MTLPGLQNVPAGFKQCHLKACYVTEKPSRKRDLRREGWEIQEKKTLLGEASTPPPPNYSLNWEGSAVRTDPSHLLSWLGGC